MHDNGPATSDLRFSSAMELACQSVGRLVEFWGFRSVMGRVWVLLYLNDEPLDSETIRRRLGISSGSCSMALNDLDRLGVVEKMPPLHGRKVRYRAVIDLWRVATTVLGEREDRELQRSIGMLKRSLALVHAEGGDTELTLRMQRLAGFLLVVRWLLRVFAVTGMLNISPMRRPLDQGQYDAAMHQEAPLADLWQES